MDSNDRQAIEGLFTKLGEVERQAGPRDAEAERFIADSVNQQPGAPYYMAQTIVMQEMALANQQKRIEELERTAQAGGAAPGLHAAAAAQQAPAQQPEGGMLSRIFGGGGSSRSVPSVGGNRGSDARPGSAWGGAAAAQQNAGQNTQAGYAQQGRGMGGGGFLAGAAQTAMGVAGGVLLGNALGNMFGGNEAQAATPAADATPAAEPAADQNADNAAGNEPEVQDASADDGGWFGGDDGGGFDDI